ncbi:uncharacterized protein LOC132196544 isoform X1 [Neocloeon triangulifer]|uniref:uncharacterized protein LOC132196544 isoform X1 n=1 Tax=Neocloeon triangulifer TaxID=2078957 RepID=UPI00286F427E|nr:uncharacterized protein LOC132196544 isoform X1 [Neocloeon triangulifer]
MHRSVRNAQLQQPPPVGWREGVFNETKVVSRPYLIAEFEPTEDFADLLMTPNGPGTIAMPPRSLASLSAVCDGWKRRTSLKAPEMKLSKAMRKWRNCSIPG